MADKRSITLHEINKGLSKSQCLENIRRYFCQDEQILLHKKLIYLENVRYFIAYLQKLSHSGESETKVKEICGSLLHILASCAALKTDGGMLTATALCSALSIAMPLTKIAALLQYCLHLSPSKQINADFKDYPSIAVHSTELFKVCLCYGLLCSNTLACQLLKPGSNFSSSFLSAMLNIVERACMKYSSLTTAAFKVLVKGMQWAVLEAKLQLSESEKEKVFSIVISNWENPISGVKENNAKIFDLLLESCTAEEDKYSVTNLMKHTMQECSWRQKSKYYMLNVLLPKYGVKKVCKDFEDIVNGLESSLYNSYLVPAGSDLYKTCISQMEFQDWSNTFMAVVINILSSTDCENGTAAQNIIHHWLPGTLKRFPELLKILIAQLMEQLNDESSDNLQLSILCLLHFGRKEGQLLSEWDATSEALKIVHEALQHSNELIRAEAFAVVCTCSKSTAIPSHTELAAVQSFLTENINADNAVLRYAILKSWSSLAARINSSCLHLLKVSANRNENVKNSNIHTILQFLNNIHTFLISNLAPGTNYQRRILSLKLYNSTLQCFCKDNENKITLYAKKQCYWNYDTEKSLEVILHCVADPTDDIRETAAKILTQYFRSSISNTVMLLQQAVKLCGSPIFYEADSGAELMKIVGTWISCSEYNLQIIANGKTRYIYDKILENQHRLLEGLGIRKRLIESTVPIYLQSKDKKFERIVTLMKDLPEIDNVQQDLPELNDSVCLDSQDMAHQHCPEPVTLTASNVIQQEKSKNNGFPASTVQQDLPKLNGLVCLDSKGIAHPHCSESVILTASNVQQDLAKLNGSVCLDGQDMADLHFTEPVILTASPLEQQEVSKNKELPSSNVQQDVPTFEDTVFFDCEDIVDPHCPEPVTFIASNVIEQQEESKNKELSASNVQQDLPMFEDTVYFDGEETVHPQCPEPETLTASNVTEQQEESKNKELPASNVQQYLPKLSGSVCLDSQDMADLHFPEPVILTASNVTEQQEESKNKELPASNVQQYLPQLSGSVCLDSQDMADLHFPEPVILTASNVTEQQEESKNKELLASNVQQDLPTFEDTVYFDCEEMVHPHCPEPETLTASNVTEQQEESENKELPASNVQQYLPQLSGSVCLDSQDMADLHFPEPVILTASPLEQQEEFKNKELPTSNVQQDLPEFEDTVYFDCEDMVHPHCPEPVTLTDSGVNQCCNEHHELPHASPLEQQNKSENKKLPASNVVQQSFIQDNHVHHFIPEQELVNIDEACSLPVALIRWTEEQLAHCKQDFLGALISGSPLCGMLSAISKTAIHSDGPEHNYITSSDIDRIVTLLEDVSSHMLHLLESNTQDTEFAPSFAEMDMAIQNIIDQSMSVVISKKVDHTQLSPAHQLILNSIWLNLKACCNLANDTASHPKCSVMELRRCSQVITQVLLKCRHKGAIESAGSSLCCFVRNVTKSSRELGILEDLLSEFLGMLQCGNIRVSVSRRSAGLAILTHRIVSNDMRPGKPFLQYCIARLLHVAKMSVSSNQDKTDLPQVQAMHSLRMLVQDASLHQEISSYLGALMLMCFGYFSSSIWTIRNAALQLSGALIPKLARQNKVHNEDCLGGSTVSIEEFFNHYYDLAKYMLQSLQQANGNEQHSTLVPMLSLLTKLSITSDIFLSPGLKTLAEKFSFYFLRLLRSPIYHVRKLSAKALERFTPLPHVHNQLSTIICKLQECCNQSTDIACPQSKENNINGLLLAVKYLIEKLKMDSLSQSKHDETVKAMLKQLNCLNISFYLNKLLLLEILEDQFQDELDNRRETLIDLYNTVKAEECSSIPKPGLHQWASKIAQSIIKRCPSQDLPLTCHNLCILFKNYSDITVSALETLIWRIVHDNKIDTAVHSLLLLTLTNIGFEITSSAHSSIAFSFMKVMLVLVEKQQLTVVFSFESLKESFSRFICQNSKALHNAVALPVVTGLLHHAYSMHAFKENRKFLEFIKFLAECVTQRSNPQFYVEEFRYYAAKALSLMATVLQKVLIALQEKKYFLRQATTAVLLSFLMLLQDENTEIRKQAAKSAVKYLPHCHSALNPQTCIHKLLEPDFLLTMLSSSDACAFLSSGLSYTEELCYLSEKYRRLAKFKNKTIVNPFDFGKSNFYAEENKIVDLYGKNLLKLLHLEKNEETLVHIKKIITRDNLKADAETFLSLPNEVHSATASSKNASTFYSVASKLAYLLEAAAVLVAESPTSNSSYSLLSSQLNSKAIGFSYSQ